MGHKPHITPQKAAAYRAAAEQSATSEMSDRQAEAKAKELWGNNGAAWHNGCARKGDLRYCQVGLRVGDVQEGWKVLGHGANWVAAFLNAKQKGYCE